MASSSEDEVLQSLMPMEREAGRSPEAYGDDSTPLVSKVADPHPSNWGSMTSKARTASDAYIKFLKGVR
jgi:hypothetical protein